MRVLFCRSNPIAPDPRVEKEARSLVAGGFEVSAIAWDRTTQLPANESKDGFEIHRLPIRAGYAQGVGNFPALLRWQLGLLRWLAAHRNSYDTIHACDFDTVLPALVAKALFGKRVVYDIFDFYADHLRRTPVWLKKLIRRVDLFAISRADGLILADGSRWEQVAGARLPENAIVIYNSPEDRIDHVDPPGEQTGKGFSLVYVGLMQVERGLVEMLEVMERHSDWMLALAGFGGDEALILEKAASLPNVTFHGRVPYQQALQLSAAADALFATYDPTIPNHRYSSPNKIFEAMMLGKPVVVAAGTNMDRIVQAGRCGLVVNYGQVDELDQALSQLAGDPQFCRQLGDNARRAYEEEYSWEKMQAALVAFYGSI